LFAEPVPKIIFFAYRPPMITSVLRQMWRTLVSKDEIVVTG
jgi:hypothetical protein